MPATVLDTLDEKEHTMTVMIGVDPHKGSHWRSPSTLASAASPSCGCVPVPSSSSGNRGAGSGLDDAADNHDVIRAAHSTVRNDCRRSCCGAAPVDGGGRAARLGPRWRRHRH